MFEDWRKMRNNKIVVTGQCPILQPLDQLGVPDLVYSLERFVHKARKKDKTDYPDETLYEIVMALQGYLCVRGREIKLFEDPLFKSVKNNLDNRMKELSKKGVVRANNQAVPISQEEENLLWDANLLGDDNPERLLHTLVYLFGIHFALRGGEEHRALTMKSVTIHYDPIQKISYLECRVDNMKNNQGGIQERHQKPKVVRVYANQQSRNCCVVRIFQKYKMLRPNSNPRCSPALCLRPLAKFTCGKGPWFTCQPVGQHTLRKITSDLCSQAGVKGKRTNHTLKATAATRLYNEGVDEQLIQEHLGNTSKAIRRYKRTSNAQRRQLTDILYGTVPMKKRSKPTATVSKPPPDPTPEPEISMQHEPEIVEVVDSDAGVDQGTVTNPNNDANNVNNVSVQAEGGAVHGSISTNVTGHTPFINFNPVINVPSIPTADQPLRINVSVMLPAFCERCHVEIQRN